MGEIKIWALHTTCTCATLVFGAVYYKKKRKESTVTKKIQQIQTPLVTCVLN